MVIRLFLAFAPVLIWSGCGKDDAPAPGPVQKTSDSGTHAHDGGGDGAPANLDCKSAQWSTFPAACWSCFCKKCEKQLDACGPDCVKGIQCANDKHALVGVAGDLACEIRAFSALCLSDPVLAAASGPLLDFDTCLITSHDPATEKLRACEAECGVNYTGDVCSRFPAPDAAP